MLNDPVALRELVARADRRQFAVGSVRDLPEGVKVDIACAIVEAHIEELEERVDQPDTAIADDVRLLFVVAALRYFVEEADVIPDHLPNGHLDDIAVLNFALTFALRGTSS